MLTVSKPTSTRSPPPCCQWEKTWKQMLCSNGGGPSRPSPAISIVTARRCAPICPEKGLPGVRRPARPDALADYRDYIAARFADDAAPVGLGAL